MSLQSKTLWYEGMFLSPQHFQQQERYFERFVDSKCSAFGVYGWGLQEFELDKELLKLGKIVIIHAKGVFPDGTPFNFPDIDEPPPVFVVPENTHNSIVYLGVPVKRSGAMDVVSDLTSQGLARYYSHDQEIRDVTTDSGENLSLEVGKLRIRVLLESDDRSGYACFGILQVSESREDKNIILDEQYIATSLDCNIAPQLVGFLSEIVGLLHHRAEAIAGRLADANRGGTAEVADYMMLQFINRIEPMCLHMSQMNGLHPIDLYTQIIQMAGELSTFVTKEKRPPSFPPYLHDELQDSFVPIMDSIRGGLSTVYEQTAISLNLEDKSYGIKVAQITDRSLIGSSMFVLAARADVKQSILRSGLPAQLKIASVERIRQLVNAGMSGIGMKPLPVAPRQIPFRSGYTYFELDRQSGFWKELQNSGGIAMHVGGDFPGLELEFWAIRQ
ncbi:MAG: type VI secretion system baseplate subunit TssK [Thiohalomonadales bacterium]